MTKKKILLLVLSLLGLVTSILLTRMHYDFVTKGFEGKSFCHVSEFFDCDTALASQYSKIGSFPIAELGVVFYLIVSLGLIASFFLKNPRSVLSFLFFMTVPAVAYSAVLGYLSFVHLGVLCLLCLTTYAVNLLLFLLLPCALDVPLRDVPGALFRNGKSQFFTHAILAVLILGSSMIFFRGLNPAAHRNRPEVPRAAYLQAFESIPQKEIDSTGRPFWGNADAKVVIVEFSDFQCPFCRRAAFTLKPYLNAFKDRVKLVFMYYPLDSSCNPAIQAAMHPVSCMASKATICAGLQGDFWDYHDGVFENQKRLSRSVLLDLAKDQKYDVAAFEQCLASDATSEILKKDVEQGNKLEIRGTPSVYINGRLFPDWVDPKRLQMVLESELQKSTP